MIDHTIKKLLDGIEDKSPSDQAEIYRRAFFLCAQMIDNYLLTMNSVGNSLRLLSDRLDQVERQTARLAQPGAYR